MAKKVIIKSPVKTNVFEKFSKRKTKASKGTYKTSKNLFEKVLNNSKKHEHQNRLLKDKNDVKKT